MPCSVRIRSEEHTSELQSPCNLVCRVLFRSDRKSTRLNSSHLVISYAVFFLKKKRDSCIACVSGRKFGAHITSTSKHHKTMNDPGRANAYHKNKAGSIFAKKVLFFFEMDKTSQEYLPPPKQNFERR